MSTISPEDFFPDDTEDWPDPEDEYPGVDELSGEGDQ